VPVHPSLRGMDPSVDVAAVVLDVGGVLLGPDRDLLRDELTAVGVALAAPLPPDLHHRAVAAFERHRGETLPRDIDHGYRHGLVLALRVADGQRDRAGSALDQLFLRPSIDVWREVLPGAREGLSGLAARGVPVAIVSNSDGSVTSQLAEHRLAQVGDGPGTRVAAIVDSHLVGVRKPDPAVFRSALDALDLPAARCLYVGDTLSYDVAGALAAGLVPVHLDPVGWCDGDHEHVRWLDDVLRWFPEAEPGHDRDERR
jgi:putative hydrolase of the HAD superfamily